MNKLIPIFFGIAGSIGLEIGGWFLLDPKITDPYKEKYKHAIIEDNDTLWSIKFISLKGQSPTNEKLKKAASNEGDETTRNKLHKEGCKEIYESSIKGNKYFEDFKQYCSKSNHDAITFGWITEDTVVNSPSSKWDNKLTTLKNNKDKESILKLKGLVVKLTDTSFDKSKRNELKEWCDSQQKEIFLGEQNDSTKKIRDYCIENSDG